MEAGRPSFRPESDQFFGSEAGIRVGSEKWEDGNTANGDWNRESDRKTSDS